MAKDPRVVILDANVLMMPFQFFMDLESELQRVVEGPFDLAVPDVILAELRLLTEEAHGKDAQEARMALELAAGHRELTAPEGVDPDTAILRLATEHNAIVVTNDRILRARLRAKGVPNIHMRSRAFLALEGA